MKPLSHWFKRQALSALALMPIPSIAVAAESALTAEVNSVERLKALKTLDANTLGTNGTWHLLNPKMRRLREEILPPLTVKTTLEQALERYRARHPELSGAEADAAFEAVVEALLDRGLITLNEGALTSHGDSEGGANPET